MSKTTFAWQHAEIDAEHQRLRQYPAASSTWPTRADYGPRSQELQRRRAAAVPPGVSATMVFAAAAGGGALTWTETR